MGFLRLTFVFAVFFISAVGYLQLMPGKLPRRISFEKISTKDYILVPKGFSSYALDMGQVLGGKWWEGSLNFEGGRGGVKAMPFNFKRKKLDELVRPLAPFTLRLGGSEADSVLYEIDTNRSVLTQEELKQGFQTILNRERLNSIKRFISENDIELMFTLNVGPGYREDGKLNYQALEEFLSKLSKEIPNIKVFELGNEINAFFLNYGLSGQIFLKQYADDYLAVKSILRKYYPNAKLAGPANAFWPYIGEVFKTFTLNSKRLIEHLGSELDLLTWHYYPTQSVRCPVQIEKADKESMLESIFYDDYINQAIVLTRKAHQEGVSSVWLGETGPAQCGGQPLVSQSFESAMWYFDHLFKTLKSGQEKLIRQTLVGSDYGLINNKDLSVNFDYYVARIFASLSPKVMLTNGHSLLHSFCDDEGYLFHAFVLENERELKLPKGDHWLASLSERSFSQFSVESFNKELTRNFVKVKGKINPSGKTINIIRTDGHDQRCENILKGQAGK
ncbi:MAG: hypothetical protein CME64_17150 [Halobacteriovoraceae bacterium]|nr:hypothetical protein [Halobacteriovoraceae bacterium]|tara:strand:+ start:254214 stop:255725 length:1512 start_codon:yes stop_codon:yes gene_type:complete